MTKIAEEIFQEKIYLLKLNNLYNLKIWLCLIKKSNLNIVIVIIGYRVNNKSEINDLIKIKILNKFH